MRPRYGISHDKLHAFRRPAVPVPDVAAMAFGVREDTVRLWRGDFMRGGVAALKASVAPGRAPVKSEAALRVALPLLEQPMADRPNWTIPRLCAEREAQVGVPISRAQLSKALRKESSAGAVRAIR